MFTVIIYAASEYPEFIKADCNSFQVRDTYTIDLGALKLKFTSEIIAITNETHTLWLSRDWTDASFTKETLLPNWPLK